MTPTRCTRPSPPRCPPRRATASSGCTPPPRPPRDAAARQARIEAGAAAIDALAARLAGPKCRLKTRVAVEAEAAAALDPRRRRAMGQLHPSARPSRRPTARNAAAGPVRTPATAATPHPLHHQLGHPPGRAGLRRGHRRLLPADHQRHHADRRRGARRLPLPAQPRTPPPPAQVRAARRPGAATQPRPHRGAVLLPVPRAAARRPDRTRDPHRDGRRSTPATSRSTPSCAPAPRPPPSASWRSSPTSPATTYTATVAHVQTFEPELNPLQQQVLDLLAVPTTAYSRT